MSFSLLLASVIAICAQTPQSYSQAVTTTLGTITQTSTAMTQTTLYDSRIVVVARHDPKYGCMPSVFLTFNATRGERISVKLTTNVSIGFLVASEANYTAWRGTGTCAVTAWNEHFLAGQESTGLSYSAEFPVPVSGKYRIVFINYSSEKNANISFSLAVKDTLATMIVVSTICSTLTSVSQQQLSLGSLSSFQQVLGAAATGASIIVGWLFKTGKRRFLSGYLTKIDSVYNAYALNKEVSGASFTNER